MKYTKELLESILEEGKALPLEEYKKYNQRLHVRFRCQCGQEATKRFEMLNAYRSPYCKDCSKKVNIERRNKTWKNKYGVENIFQDETTKEKINEVWKNKYGCHPKQTKEVQEKWKQTCLEKYGGHHNQNAEIQTRTEKSSFKHRDYRMPSGKIVKIQGYEDKALDELLEQFTEEEITVGRGNVPSIAYICKEGKKRIYFPDFFIEPMNTILEIKSQWTIQLSTCRLEEKAKSVIDKGYAFEVWVYDNKKEKKEVLTF